MRGKLSRPYVVHPETAFATPARSSRSGGARSSSNPNDVQLFTGSDVSASDDVDDEAGEDVLLGDDSDDDFGFAQAAPDVLREDVEAIIMDLKEVIMRHKRANAKLQHLVQHERKLKDDTSRKYQDLNRQYENLMAMQQFQASPNSMAQSSAKGLSVQTSGQDSSIFQSGYSYAEGQMLLAVNDDELTPCRKCYQGMIRRFMRVVPLQAQYHLIQARYGESVGSYFSFLRWMVMINFLMAVVGIIYFGVHVHHLRGVAEATEVADAAAAQNTSNSIETLAEIGEDLIAFRWTYDHFFHLQGISPRVLLLSSYDPGEQGDDEGTNFGERIHYTLFILTMAVAFWLTAAIKFVKENRLSVLNRGSGAAGAKHALRHSRFVLSAWDFSIQDNSEVENRKYALGEGLFGLAFEDAIEALQKTRNVKRLLLRRIKQAIGFILYFIALAGAVATIIWASAQVGNGSVDRLVQQSFLASVSFIDVSAFVVPVTVSVFNLAIPKMVQLTSAYLERWDSAGTALKMDLWRMYLCKVLNSMIAIFGRMLLADPYMLVTDFLEYEAMHDFLGTFRAAIASQMTFSDQGTMKVDQTTAALVDVQNLYSQAKATGSTDNFVPYRDRMLPCRLDQVGQALFLLVLTEWAVNKIAKLAIVLVMKVLRGKKYRRLVFMVPVEMVSTLYFQLLTLVCFPFSPYLSTILGALLWLANFEFYYMLMNQFYRKPDKPWNSRNAGYWFIITYILTAAIAMLAWIFLLKATTLPKSCSRLHTDTAEALNKSLSTNVTLFSQRLPEERCLWDYSTVAAEEEAGLNSNNASLCGSTNYTALDFGLVLEDMQLAAGASNASVLSGTGNATTLRALLSSSTGNVTDIDLNTLSICLFACGPYRYSRSGFSSFSEYCTGTAAGPVAAWTYTLVFESIELVYILAAVLAVLVVAKTNQIASLRFWSEKSTEAIVKESTRLKENLVVLHDRYNMVLRRLQDKDE